MSDAAYDASGGGGIANTRDLGDGRLHVTFDPETLYIPDVNYKTAKFLGAPMVPPFRIKIKPVKLEVTETFFAWLQRSIGMTGTHAVKSVQGEINRATGEAALEFIANFMFTAGPIYKVSLQGVAMSFVSEAKCAYIHDSSSFALAGATAVCGDPFDNRRGARNTKTWKWLTTRCQWLLQVSVSYDTSRS